MAFQVGEMVGARPQSGLGRFESERDLAGEMTPTGGEA